MSELARIDFRANVQRIPPRIPAAIQKATATFAALRDSAIAEVGADQWETLRQAGHDVRQHAIANLDSYLIQLEERVTAAGGQVHWARDAAEARRIVLEIARAEKVRRVVKSKSMVTEEIGLNRALEEEGVRVVETDLGEYIIQLAGTGPSHIIAPAIHLTKEDVAGIFSDRLGVDTPPDPVALNALARAGLREEFLAADMGITGANFLVAENGTLVLVSNEGNARMCTTVPPVHVALVGIEKVVPDLDSLTVLLKLLARNATGQKLTAYTSFITGPRRPGEEQGPRVFHLILLDNGRTRVLQDKATREALQCIRCGACLNVCPIFNHASGYAYGWMYSGPIGAALAPPMLGARTAAALPFACTLCGACADICPVKIPIPDLLLHLRHRAMEGDASEPAVSSPLVRVAVRASAAVLKRPRLYRVASRLLGIAQLPWRRGGWLASLPPPLDRWTLARPLPAVQTGFRDWWQQRDATAAPPRRGRWLGPTLLLVGAGVAIAIRRARRRTR